MASKFLTEEWADEVSSILNSHPGFKSAIANADLGIVYNVSGTPSGDVSYFIKTAAGSAELGSGHPRQSRRHGRQHLRHGRLDLERRPQHPDRLHDRQTQSGRQPGQVDDAPGSHQPVGRRRQGHASRVLDRRRLSSSGGAMQDK